MNLAQIPVKYNLWVLMMYIYTLTKRDFEHWHPSPIISFASIHHLRFDDFPSEHSTNFTQPGVIVYMAGWEIPALNGGFSRKIPNSMVNFLLPCLIPGGYCRSQKAWSWCRRRVLFSRNKLDICWKLIFVASWSKSFWTWRKIAKTASNVWCKDRTSWWSSGVWGTLTVSQGWENWWFVFFCTIHAPI